jgi:hypothetical protein
MLTKKQMLIALMLGASAMGASYSVDLAKVASNKDIRQLQYIAQPLGELVTEFKNSALTKPNGDFEGIETALAKVDLTPAIQFLIDNIDNFRDKLEGFVKILQKQIPDNAKYEGIVKTVLEKMQSFETFKNNLMTLLPYGNLATNQAIITKAIKAANNDPKFREQLQNDIKKIAAKLTANGGLLDQIKAIDVEIIQKALKSVENLHDNFEKGDIDLAIVLTDITPGIKELRMKLLPIAPAIATELTATIIDIYNTLMAKSAAVQAQYELPAEVVNALHEINKVGSQIKADISILNGDISGLVKEALLN